MAENQINHWKVLRREISSGKVFPCHYCGQRVRGRSCTVDHVVPRSKGGTNDPSNLVVACFGCNQKKADMPVEKFLSVRKTPSLFRKPKLHKLEAAVVAAKAMHKRRKDESSSREVDLAQARAKIHFGFLF